VHRRFQYAILILLLINTAAGIYVGALRLARSPWPFAGDLYLRWTEERNFASGHNPASDSPDAIMPYFSPDSKINGILTAADYPPWSYASELVFVPPLPFKIVRLYFVGECLLSLGVMAYWAGKISAPYRQPWPAIAACLALSMASISYCLSNGQYAIIITGLLVCCLLMIQRGQHVAAGIFMGFALLKPSLSMPFLAVFLALRLWLPLMVALGLNVVSCLVEWAITGCSPMMILHQSSVNLRYWENTGHNFVTSMIALTANGNQLVEAAVMATVGLIGLGAIYFAYQRGCGVVTMFAIAAVTGLSWTYRKEYDVVAIVFLLVELLAVALKTRNRWAVASLIFCCLFVIPPFRMKDHNLLAMQFLELLSWLLGIWVLLQLDRSGNRTNGYSRAAGNDPLIASDIARC
jgi:Glycosyltransferase family 87